ncbi:MAG: hypothetical protein H0U59_04125 [Gemmatimonadaceae bacterium]|nr:hypothetical protein [Gemmatimonadaceae bacterium]
MTPISDEDRQQMTPAERDLWEKLTHLAWELHELADSFDHHTLHLAAFDIMNTAQAALKKPGPASSAIPSSEHALIDLLQRITPKAKK